MEKFYGNDTQEETSERFNMSAELTAESATELGWILENFDEIRPAKTSTKSQLIISIWMYGGPLLFFIGIVGNILILVVMSQRRMRGTSTSIYLKCMALADMFALVGGMLPEWLKESKLILLRDVDQSICKMEKVIFFTSSDTSIWICVIFTIDRFVAVCFPLEQRRFSKSRHAAGFSCAAFCVAVIKNIHFFWTRGPEYKAIPGTNITQLNQKCGVSNPEYNYFETFVRPWIAFAVVMLIPCVIIVICNFFIVRVMVRLRNKSKRNIIISASDKSILQMTTLCLSASFCFVIFITPSIVLRLGKPYWSDPPTYTHDVVKAVVNLTFYANHSINFFLYCITGQKFREELRAIFVKDTNVGYYFSTPRNSLDVTAAVRISPMRARSLAINLKYDSNDVMYASDDVRSKSKDVRRQSQ